MKPRILIVEDGKDYQLILEHILKNDYEIDFADCAEVAYAKIQSNTYDLFLLDLVLPDSNGLQICNFLRSQEVYKNTPIIIVTSKDSHEDTIKSLEFGADDHVTKPFDTKELLLRVKSKLRSYSSTSANAFQVGGLAIDVAKQEVKDSSGQHIELTRIEFKLLIFFANRIDHVLSREQLLDNVWSDNLNVSERTVDTHVSNLRRKIKDSKLALKGVHGSGYRATIED